MLHILTFHKISYLKKMNERNYLNFIFLLQNYQKPHPLFMWNGIGTVWVIPFVQIVHHHHLGHQQSLHSMLMIYRSVYILPSLIFQGIKKGSRWMLFCIVKAFSYDICVYDINSLKRYGYLCQLCTDGISLCFFVCLMFWIWFIWFRLCLLQRFYLTNGYG